MIASLSMLDEGAMTVKVRLIRNSGWRPLLHISRHCRPAGRSELASRQTDVKPQPVQTPHVIGVRLIAQLHA